MVYHSSSYLDLCRDGVIRFGDPVDVCIPTGNFGNAMSAIYAKQMGVPIRRVICASNHNRIITDFFSTGEYDLRRRRLLPSHSPAIDIFKSSNLERFLFHASGGDSGLVGELFARLDAQQHFRVAAPLLSRMQQEVQAGCCSEDECLSAVRHVHARTGYLMDTHTAVAKVVADQLQDGSCPVVLSSTAHYGKFAPAVFQALGVQNPPEDPVEQLRLLERSAARPGAHGDMLRGLRGGSGPHAVCQADYRELEEKVESVIRESFMKVQ